MTSNERRCYVVLVRLDGLDRFILWESGDDAPDRIVLDDAGRLMSFASERAAGEFAISHARALSTEDVSAFDLDRHQ